MDYIEIWFTNGDRIDMKGRISVEQGCVYVKVDDDKDPTTPPLNIIYPLSTIREVHYRELEPESK